MRHPRVTATSLLVGALLLGGCSGTGEKERGAGRPAGAATSTAQVTAPPGEPPVDAANFKDCTDNIKPQIQDQPGGDRDLSFGCATLRVPLDYAKPDGDKVKLFLVRVRMGDQRDRIGSILINPGGPGGSGLDAAVGLALQMPTDVLSRFDLVGFDPRGVGLSDGVECISDSEKDQITAADPDARTPQEFQQQVTLARDVTQGCSRKYGDRLAHFNTVETVRDMDLIRRAVGDEKLTYLGFSYGTLLGAVYAQLFPDRVRAMTLDGAVDPAQSDLAANEGQAKGFENAFNQFAAACKAKKAQCPLGPDPRRFVTALIDKARTSPIPSAKADDTRKATGGNIQLAVISALYDENEWDELARALSLANRGNAEGIFALDDRYNERDSKGHYTNILDANITINCNDTNEQLGQAAIQAKVADWRKKYPLFGASQALSLLTCQAWKPARHPVPAIQGNGTPPILVVGTVNDPATPYDSAKALASELQSGVLLTWDGEGHTAYPKTACVTTAVDAYLVSLTVPQGDTSCPSK